jgi:GTP cyclohydrolase II
MKQTVEFIAKANLPTCFGAFEVYAFKSSDGKEHVALMSGESEEVNVRIHSKCLTGDTFCSLRCDCRAQLEASLELIGKEGGVLIYLDQEGRGIGLANKIKAYALQEHGRDTVDANKELGFDADLRDYSVAAGILTFLRIKKIKLITNNPQKMKGLEGDGIEIIERIPLNTAPNKFNKHYLETKKKKMGHLD